MSVGFHKRGLLTSYAFVLVVVLYFGTATLAVEEIESAAEKPVIPTPSSSEAQEIAAKESVISKMTPLERVANSLERFELQYSGGKYHDETFFYRLYSPKNLIAGEKYPLLVWLLPGAGPLETQPRHLADGLVRWRKTEGRDYPAFILVPISPHNLGWETGRVGEDAPLTIAWTMLEHVIQEYPIDKDRISLSGVSAGGAACWEMGIRHPERFAAIVPICSEGGGTSRVGQLIKTPVWAFHNIYDKGTPISGVRSTVSALQAAGGQVILTELEKGGHNSWIPAFNQYEILAWFLDRKRGDRLWWPKEVRNQWLKTRVAPAAGLVGFFAILWFASKKEIRRRKKISLQDSN